MTEHRHRWTGGNCVAALTGHDAFREQVKRIAGVDLPHAGYTTRRCSCGKAQIIDYCGGPWYDITLEAFEELSSGSAYVRRSS